MDTSKPTRDELQFARDFIVKPARDQWGPGWRLLSEAQQDQAIGNSMWNHVWGAAGRADALPLDPEILRRTWAAVCWLLVKERGE